MGMHHVIYDLPGFQLLTAGTDKAVQPGRIAINQAIVRHIARYDRPRPDHGVGADDDARQEGGIRADGSPFTHQRAG